MTHLCDNVQHTEYRVLNLLHRINYEIVAGMKVQT